MAPADPLSAAALAGAYSGPPSRRTTQDYAGQPAGVSAGDAYRQIMEAAASASLLAAAAADASAVPLVGPMHVPCTISTMPVYEPETVLGSMLRPIELMADGTVVCLKVDSRGFIPAGKPEFYYARKELSPSQATSPGSNPAGAGAPHAHMPAPSTGSPPGGGAPRIDAHKRRATVDEMDSKMPQAASPKRRRQVPLEPVTPLDQRQLTVLSDMYGMWGGGDFSLRSSVRVRELPALIQQMVELMEKHGVSLADLHTWSTQHQQWCKQNGKQEPFTFNRGLFGSRITQILFARLSDFHSTVGLSQEDTVGKWITCIEKQGKPYEEHQAAMGAQYPYLKTLLGKDARTKLKVLSAASSMAEAETIANSLLTPPMPVWRPPPASGAAAAVSGSGSD